MEAALRTAYFKLSGKELDNLDFESVRGDGGVKEASVNINGLQLNIAVVNGIGNVKNVIDEIKAGKSKYHFIEVMACPGGCINGGGQPIHQKPEKVRKRIKALYQIDADMQKRRSHENESVKILYKEFLGEPNSHKAHEVLHTEYFNRKEILNN
jgi:iron only hydrogenase large subunit-like protein